MSQSFVGRTLHILHGAFDLTSTHQPAGGHPERAGPAPYHHIKKPMPLSEPKRQPRWIPTTLGCFSFW